ncbi:MAG: hypothetical protein PHP23_15590 [Desulfobacterales bacterium]|nr:hypothetical protein [Desulfobacterales bacterium]MDD4071762.1 hypothetical protein [Desulfobacterales bacterium]MDD4391972.1 hypothetical protein [Desulfobacterales bacterium]
MICLNNITKQHGDQILFRGDDAGKRIDKLTGGENSRVVRVSHDRKKQGRQAPRILKIQNIIDFSHQAQVHKKMFNFFDRLRTPDEFYFDAVSLSVKWTWKYSAESDTIKKIMANQPFFWKNSLQI